MLGWVALLLFLVVLRIAPDFGPVPEYDPELAAKQNAEWRGSLTPQFRSFYVWVLPLKCEGKHGRER